MIDTTALIERVVGEVANTRDRYAALARPRIQVHPIPFSGRINDAIVATVGANPSDSEFGEDGRAETSTASRWATHLESYFSGPAHPWFLSWTASLAEIDPECSYQRGSAVHLDLSPRATRPMGSLNSGDARLYEEMLRHDVKWFFESVAAMDRLRLLLIAGCAGRKYMDTFLTRVAPDSQSLLVGRARRGGDAGVNYYYLKAQNGRRIPTFFCSVSPSNWSKRGLLQRRIAENCDALTPLLHTGDDALFRARHAEQNG